MSAVRMTMAAVMCSLAATAPVSGQSDAHRLHLSGGWGVGLLVGEGSGLVDGGMGPWVSGAWHRGQGASFGVAVTTEWMRLDDDTDERTGAEAHNTLLSASVGPTVGVWLGPVRPWLGGFAGVALGRWSTESREGDAGGSEVTFAWGGTGGVEARVIEGEHPVSIYGAARITDVGLLTFARAPALDRPLEPTGLVERDVALMSIRLGVTIGLYQP